MDKSTTNQVRQVLMNELGLTRESIREMAHQLIKQEVEKTVNVMASTGVLDRIIHEALDTMLGRSRSRYGGTSVQTIVTNAVTDLANAWVKDNLRIEVGIVAPAPEPGLPGCVLGLRPKPNAV